MSDTVLKVDNVNSRLISTDANLKKLLAEKLRFRPKNYWHNAAYQAKKWDGWKYFFSEKSGMFLTGILPEVQKALSVLKKEYVFVDTRDKPIWGETSIDQNFLNQWLPNGVDPVTLHDFQPDLVNQCINYNRGLVQAPTGCHRKGQQILMFSGRTKMVEDVVVGDLLMGPDSTPRRVLKLVRNKGQMYKIVPVKGAPFVVNEDHILTLVKTAKNPKGCPCERGGQVIDVSVKDWLAWPKSRKHLFKLFRVPVHFEQKRQPHSISKIDPYFLGVLLGDGSLHGSPTVTTTDTEIVTEVYRQADRYNLVVKERLSEDKCPQYALVAETSHGCDGGSNLLANRLRYLGLWDKRCADKFVPASYKTSTQVERLEMLAGLMDTDGSLGNNIYDFVSKAKQLAEDVAFLARSVGLAAYTKPYKKKSQHGTEGTYYRVGISGNIDIIPCRLKHKQASPRKQKKDVLRTGFKAEKLGVENYYGFVLDGDQRYLLSDFTVTHNSGKTFILISLLKCLPPKTPTLFLTKSASLVHQNWQQMKKWGVENLGRWYDSYKEPNYVMCCTVHKKTFESLEKLLPKFKVLIVDEVHDCMSDVPVSAYRKMKKCAVRVGISATAYKWWKKKIDDCHKWQVKGHFGPIFKTTTTESGILTTKDLQDRGILAKSNCFIYVIDRPNLAYEPYSDAVKLGIEQNFYFHDVVSRLAKKCPGRTLIVVERIEQGEYLKALIPGSSFIQGATALKEREPILNSLKEGEKSVAIVMKQIITAGIDIKIHDLINAAGGEGAHNIIQLMGRGLRPADDKELLRYHDFHFLMNDYLRKHSEWRMEVLEDQGHELHYKETIDF
jgi:superfamily II DNA or RNA helicase